MRLGAWPEITVLTLKKEITNQSNKIYHTYEILIHHLSNLYRASHFSCADHSDRTDHHAGMLAGQRTLLGYYPGKIWSQLTCFLFLLPVKVEGHKNIDHKTSYVFVANHQGAFDIFLIYGFLGRNFKWMMKKSLRSIPFVGKACESAGFIFVDKSSPRKVYETIKRAEKILQGGTSLVVFPEGRRTFTGRMNEFKKGAFLLADQLQLPVVPMSISGSFDILPRTGKLLSWHPLKLTIHQPIYPQGKGQENQTMLMEESYQAIEKGLTGKIQRRKEKWRIKKISGRKNFLPDILFNEGEHATYFHVPQTHIPSPCNCS